MYLLFTLSQNKTNCNHDCELARHTWKMSPHYVVKCRTHSPDGRYIVSLQTLVALKRPGCVMWQLECQASNVTATICSTWAWGHHWVFGASLMLAPALAPISPKSGVDPPKNWRLPLHPATGYGLWESAVSSPRGVRGSFVITSDYFLTSCNLVKAGSRCKSKTGRHNIKTGRVGIRLWLVAPCAPRPVLIVATALGFATRLWTWE